MFTADDGTFGGQVRLTGDATAGTAPVDDISPELNSPDPVLFSADDGTHGTELWVTSGTAAGTMLVDDINPGSTGSYPNEITALGNGTEVFSANDGTHGFELWKTDGTTAGTALVNDIYRVDRLHPIRFDRTRQREGSVRGQ